MMSIEMTPAFAYVDGALCHVLPLVMLEYAVPASPMVKAPETAAARLIAQFADRLARRDQPVEPAPLAFDEESVLQRLMMALHKHLHQRDPRRRRRLALACYALMQQPSLNASTLQRLLACSAASVSRVMNELLAAGLAERGQLGKQQPYRLTRAGEDWVLAVVRGERVAD